MMGEELNPDTLLFKNNDQANVQFPTNFNFYHDHKLSPTT